MLVNPSHYVDYSNYVGLYEFNIKLVVVTYPIRLVPLIFSLYGNDTNIYKISNVV